MKQLAWGLGLGAAILSLAFLAPAAAKRAQDDESVPEVVRVARRTIGSFVKSTGVVKPRIGAEVAAGRWNSRRVEMPLITLRRP